MIIESTVSGVVGVALQIAAFCVILALLGAAWRLWVGPTLADRVVALDLVSMLIVVFLVLFAMLSGVTAYIHAAIALALIAFLGTVAFAHYIERERGTSMIDWTTAALLVLGGGFCLIAAIGVLRLNDVYARMHAATKAGTLELGLVCLAFMLHGERWAGVVEGLFVFLFMILTTPIGAHLIGRAAFRRGQPIDPRTRMDPAVERFRGKRDL